MSKAARRTRINPNGITYRMPLTRSGTGIRIECQGGIATVFGDLIDMVGKLEDVKPLEQWLEDARRQKKQS